MDVNCIIISCWKIILNVDIILSMDMLLRIEHDTANGQNTYLKRKVTADDGKNVFGFS